MVAPLIFNVPNKLGLNYLNELLGNRTELDLKIIFCLLSYLKMFSIPISFNKLVLFTP